jgi:hypothetical protein
MYSFFKKLALIILFSIIFTGHAISQMPVQASAPELSLKISVNIAPLVKEKLEKASAVDKNRLAKAIRAANIFANDFLVGAFCTAGELDECWVQTKFANYVAMKPADWAKATGELLGYKLPKDGGMALWVDKNLVCPRIQVQQVNLQGKNTHFVYQVQKAGVVRENISVNKEKPIEYFFENQKKYIILEFSLNESNKVIDIKPAEKMYTRLMGGEIKVIRTILDGFRRGREDKARGMIVTQSKISDPFYLPLVAQLEQAATICQ